MFVAAILGMHVLKRIPIFKGIAHFAPIWNYLTIDYTYTYNVITNLNCKEFSLNIPYTNEIMTSKSAKTYSK